MWKLSFGLIILASSCILALPTASDEKCNANNCKLPNCQCYGTKPNIADDLLPQIVLISSDDAITQKNLNETYKPVYFNRKNPDGCPIGITFFVPHEYTDYGAVHALYAEGFEIGDNSVTRNSTAEYWRHASEDLLAEEFSEQRQIISKFANINIDLINASRVPLLELNGDESYNAFQKSSLSIDSSWTTREGHTWPYTLDFASPQDCPFGTCPLQPHKGQWVIPINDWVDGYNGSCATVVGCLGQGGIDDTETDILNWLKKNFHEKYDNGKEPFNVLLSVAAFSVYENFQGGFIRFLDYLKTLSDVYIVNQYQAINWMQQPKPKTDKHPFICNLQKTHSDNFQRNCGYDHSDQGPHYMGVYKSSCPPHYPWLGNPNGN